MALTPEMQALWNEVQNNMKRLKACVGPHEFVGDETEIRAVSPEGTKHYRRYVCTKCSGKLNPVDKIWYERGLEHGRKESK